MSIERFTSMAAIRAAERSGGGHWFSADTMRYFGSRIGEQLFDGRFFVTSERSPGDPNSSRRYSVRVAVRRDDTGRVGIDTVSDFRQFATGNEARNWLRIMLAADHDVTVTDTGKRIDRFVATCSCGTYTCRAAIVEWVTSQGAEHRRLWKG